MKNALLAALGAMALWGCVTKVDMPALPATHPANPEAETGMVLVPSELLSRHHPPPDTAPQGDPAQHDHMQQGGHGMPEVDGPSGMDGGMKGMEHGGMEGMKGMDHGPHDDKDAAHDHGAENQGPAIGSMSGTARSGRIYRCPIHTGESSPYVGNCSKCGKPMEEQKALNGESMESKPMKGATGQNRSAYFCTMHPQLSLASPGLCPVCGMTLIERKEGAR